MLCKFCLHVECALLPPVVKHGIHQHPLELALDLADLGDEYVSDACEKDLNPKLWVYRCLDSCKGRATSHVTCIITSNKKCRFRYEEECEGVGRVESNSEYDCAGSEESNSEYDYAGSEEDCLEDESQE